MLQKKREGLINKLKNKFSNIECGVLATTEKIASDVICGDFSGRGCLISLCRDTVCVFMLCVFL